MRCNKLGHRALVASVGRGGLGRWVVSCIMRTPRIKIIAFSTVGLSVFLVTLVLTGGRPPVSLTIRGFTTNSWRPDNSDGSCKYVLCAIVEFTNASDRPVSYLANRQSSFADYALLYPSPTGWKKPTPRVADSLGWWPFKLARSQAITFEAEIDQVKPCKVALDYSDGRTPSRLWQRLPQWIVQRLPWAKSSRTVTTDEINLVSTRR
jgi:hypothetical protein